MLNTIQTLQSSEILAVKMWTVGTHYNKERIGDYMGIAGYPTQKFRRALEAKGYKKIARMEGMKFGKNKLL